MLPDRGARRLFCFALVVRDGFHRFTVAVRARPAELVGFVGDTTAVEVVKELEVAPFGGSADA
jgi:hypothetical protein